MPLRPLPPREVIRRLRRAGFIRVRQRGSHARFRNAQGRGVTVAVHARDVPEAIIRRIIAQAGFQRKSGPASEGEDGIGASPRAEAPRLRDGDQAPALSAREKSAIFARRIVSG